MLCSGSSGIASTISPGRVASVFLSGISLLVLKRFQDRLNDRLRPLLAATLGDQYASQPLRRPIPLVVDQNVIVGGVVSNLFRGVAQAPRNDRLVIERPAAQTVFQLPPGGRQDENRNGLREPLL